MYIYKTKRHIRLNRCINSNLETQKYEKQGNMTPLKVRNSSITESKGTEMSNNSSLHLKMVNNHKENSNKQMNAVKKLTQN
jgi:hypothetical protein